MTTLISVNQNSRLDVGIRSIGPHQSCVASMRAILPCSRQLAGVRK